MLAQITSLMRRNEVIQRCQIESHKAPSDVDKNPIPTINAPQNMDKFINDTSTTNIESPDHKLLAPDSLSSTPSQIEGTRAITEGHCNESSEQSEPGSESELVGSYSGSAVNDNDSATVHAENITFHALVEELDLKDDEAIVELAIGLNSTISSIEEKAGVNISSAEPHIVPDSEQAEITSIIAVEATDQPSETEDNEAVLLKNDSLYSVSEENSVLDEEELKISTESDGALMLEQTQSTNDETPPVDQENQNETEEEPQLSEEDMELEARRSAQPYLSVANTFYSRGDANNCLKQLTIAIKKAPNYPDIYMLRGQTYLELLQDGKKAQIEFLKVYEELDKGNGTAGGVYILINTIEYIKFILT